MSVSNYNARIVKAQNTYSLQDCARLCTYYRDIGTTCNSFRCSGHQSNIFSHNNRRVHCTLHRWSYISQNIKGGIKSPLGFFQQGQFYIQNMRLIQVITEDFFLILILPK